MFSEYVVAIMMVHYDPCYLDAHLLTELKYNSINIGIY